MTAKIHVASTDVKLLIDGTTLTAAEATDADMMCRFDLTGLSADAEHTYQVQLDDKLRGPVGRFRTMPSGAPSGTPCNFTCAFAGDTNTGSDSNVFRVIRASEPLFFWHLGDLHYADISTNNQSLYHAAYDQVFRQAAQAELFRNVPSGYVWDDHCYANNNSNGTSAAKPAAAAVYRSRVPHYPLEEATGVYHSFDVGRVRFIVTDQRSAASPNSDTDNSSKTMLGATQKAWFKNLLSNSAGKLIVWICPRVFQAPTFAGADNWGGFSTERAELVDHIQANCPGRVIVWSADLHTGSLDDGSNTDYATTGSEPLVTIQAAPLDRPDRTSAGFTYSHGEFTTNGQWGEMSITDAGGASIGVTLTLRDITGAALTSYSFSVSV